MHPLSLEILLLDSQPAFANLFTAMLQSNPRFDFRLAVTAEPKTFVHELEQRELSLLVVAVESTQKNTRLEMLQHLGGKQTLPPLLVIAGEEDDAFDQAVMAAGAADCLLRRELTPTLLDRTIRHALERRTQQEAIVAAKTVAENATRVKGEFLATMSHEVRTPLNGILGILGLLKDTPLDENQSELISAAFQCSEALLALMEDILDFSDLNSGTLSLQQKPFTLTDVVKDLEHWITPLAKKKGLTFSIHNEVDSQRVLIGDPRRLCQVLLHLLNNAVKFTDQGTVAITMREAPDAGREITFSIRDSGIGISPAQLQTLFKPFSQADGSSSRRHSGTGLGLKISQLLVRAMGGSLDVESRPDQGTCFFFTAAFHESAEAVPVSPPPPAPKAKEPTFSGDHFRVLLVEDNPVNQKVTVKLLKNIHISCDVAADGAKGVTAYQENQYDLVLMDCQMPIMDGYEATRRIRDMEKETNRHIPIIAVTANAVDGNRERCLAAGMDDYLSKPVRKDTFYAKLQQYLPLRVG